MMVVLVKRGGAHADDAERCERLLFCERAAAHGARRRSVGAAKYAGQAAQASTRGRQQR